MLFGYKKKLYMVVLKRLFNVLDKEVNMIPGKIVFANVRFSYPTQVKPALDGVSFHIPPGAKFALMGPSEAAKQAEFNEFVMSLPDQYETEAGRNGISLSTALLTEPEILLLDDTSIRNPCT